MPDVPPEVIAEQYELKATFFSNRLDRSQYIGLFEFAVMALKKIGPTLDWSTKESLSIKADVFDEFVKSGKEPSLYFCHPNTLLSNPRFLIYYRCISAFSQKGLKSVSGVSAVDSIEGSGKSCSADQAFRLACAINANLSAIYAISLPSDEKMKGIMYATAGTTIDGSWRNAIGAEGERVIRSLFLQSTLEHGELSLVTRKGGSIVDSSEINNHWLDQNTNDLFSATFKNGAVALFGSEPDITIVASNGSIAAGVEIKAGIDPAGALERLGAMLKSFEKILLESSGAETILIATCITDEVQSRLSAMKGVSRTFILTDIIHNRKNKRTSLMTILRGLAGLIEARR